MNSVEQALNDAAIVVAAKRVSDELPKEERGEVLIELLYAFLIDRKDKHEFS